MWHIRNIKRSHFTPDDQLQLYKSLLRPVLDFACVAYHSLLTKGQEIELERLQKRVLKICCKHLFYCVNKLTIQYNTIHSDLLKLDVSQENFIFRRHVHLHFRLK